METRSESIPKSYRTDPITPQGRTQRAYEAVEEQVGERPASAVALAFGLGIGAGVCVGLMLSRGRASRTRDRRRSAEQLGHSLLEAVTKALPDSLTRRFSN